MNSHPRRTPPPPLAGDEAFFFDVDGTLLDIAGSPEQVRADTQLDQLIDQLYRRTGGAVALISGRAVRDIDRIFAGRRWPAAGQHGAEHRCMGAPAAAAPAPETLATARRELEDLVRRHTGLQLEDKGMSLALHYRGAPRLGAYVHRVMHRLARTLHAYQVQRGKRVVELVPAGVGKGRAIRVFMEHPPFRGRRPVFIGDDVTDEDGFAAVNAMHGQSVKVGRGPTMARWRLPDVAAVRHWLDAAPITTGAAR